MFEFIIGWFTGIATVLVVMMYIAVLKEVK